MQKRFLPTKSPETSGYRFFDYYEPANHVGGDYFDYIHLADGRIAIVVADVVGHGVAAAMFMAKLSAETRFALASKQDPAVAIAELNDRMSELEVERFVTFLLLVLDPADCSATIVNAGHMPPVIRRADGSIEEPGEDESGLPISIMGGVDYESVKIDLADGELAVMYTDGVNEAMGPDGEQFGMDKVRELVAMGGTAEEVNKRIVAAVNQHFAGTPPDDDICLVTVERVPVAAEVVDDEGDDDVAKATIATV